MCCLQVLFFHNILTASSGCCHAILIKQISLILSHIRLNNFYHVHFDRLRKPQKQASFKYTPCLSTIRYRVDPDASLAIASCRSNRAYIERNSRAVTVTGDL